MQDNESARRQGPRRRVGSEGISEEQERIPRNEETTVPAVGANTAKRDAPRKGTDDADGTVSTGSKLSNSRVVFDAFVTPSPVVALAVAIVAGLGRDDGNNVAEAEDVMTSTSSIPIVEPTDYDGAETPASLYCEFALTEYEEDWGDIYDICIQLVLDETRASEDTFRSEAVFDEPGEVGDEATEAVLGDPEDPSKSHGYTTTTLTTITTKSLTYMPSPTYQEPEPAYEEPSNSGGNTDAEVSGGGCQLARRTVGPFSGLQDYEYSASQQPLYVFECYVGSDNLYYYDSKVQADQHTPPMTSRCPAVP